MKRRVAKAAISHASGAEMKTLYLDIFSGISGDMFIGALIDLGVDAHDLEHELEKLKLEGYHLHVSRAHKAAIEGVKFDVHLAHEHSHEHMHVGGLAHTHSHSHEEHHHAHEHPHPHQHDDEGDHDHEQQHHHEDDQDAHQHEHSHHHHGEQEHEHSHGRNFSEIKKLISSSRLSD